MLDITMKELGRQLFGGGTGRFTGALEQASIPHFLLQKNPTINCLLCNQLKFSYKMKKRIRTQKESLFDCHPLSPL
jgi:hypothetical protein